MPKTRKPATPCCPHCGGDLECFEGEDYCPDCTHFEAREQLDVELDLESDIDWREMGADDPLPAEAEGRPPF